MHAAADITGLRTARLILRHWRDEDVAPFAAMSADPEVMRYFPALLSDAEAAAMVLRIRAGFIANNMGLWALEHAESRSFLGYAGLWPVLWSAPFSPAVEIGWRLARHAWGHGYATEAASAVLEDGFNRLGLREIVSSTVPANARSIAVMARLGMTRDPAEDFDYPSLPEGHPLRRHVLYRKRKG